MTPRTEMTEARTRMQLSLGPVLYNWEPARWRDFYFRIADEAPVDVVVVGEIVCSKRSHFLAPHFPAVIERLKTAGKQVLLGSLIMATSRREQHLTADLCDASENLIEANDLTACKFLVGRAHAIGPYMNIYNEASAAFHAKRGADRICLPPELPLSSIGVIAGALPEILVEVVAFGKVPLAISARCYHARVNKLSKDNCRFACEQDPDGLALRTLDNQNFLTINGVQTLSHTCLNLLADVGMLRRVGVGSLRLSPQHCDMVEVAGVFRGVLDGQIDAEVGTECLGEIYPAVPFSNGFLHGVAGVSCVTAGAALDDAVSVDASAILHRT